MTANGELELELDQALKSGRPLLAAKLAWQLGRHAQAAELFEHAQRYFEAAVAHRADGQASRALKAAMQVPEGDSCYFAAARLAIELSATLRLVSHELEQFIATFVQSSVETPEDAAALLELGQLYEMTDYLPHAIQLYQRVLEFDPGNVVAAERLELAQLSAEKSQTTEVVVSKDDVRAVREMLRAQAPAAKPISVPPPVKPSGMLDVGALLAARYKLEQLLGRGAYAVVWKALDVELGERVALKLMNPFGNDSTAAARFKREVSLARSLSHENIVRIYELGQHADRHFFTMELLEGEDLSDHALKHKVGMARRRDLLLQALDGLAFAHAQGVVHRDIKPENLFVTSKGVLKVADFGMAKGPGSSSVTMSGTMGGTPYYMSPEQITDLRSADHRSDLYALGAVAYELFTGEPPFQTNALTELLLMHLEKQAPPMRTLMPELPDALDAVVLKLLAKSRDDRYQSAVEARRALASVQF